MESDEATDKAWVARVFSATSDSHAGLEMFAHFGEQLVDWADLRKGEHVLDVGAGTGASLLPVARRVDLEGHVTGIDLAQGMVERLRAVIDEGRVTNASAQVADAEALPFRDKTFDAAVCGFTLFFFPDSQRALAELRRVLRPGGRLALSTFTRRGSASMDRTWSMLGRHIVVPRPSSGPRFDEHGQLREALGSAGFVEIEIKEIRYDVKLPDVDTWLAWIGSMEFREYLKKMDERALERLRRAARGSTGVPKARRSSSRWMLF